MKKVIVIQTATEHPEAKYSLFTCNECKWAKNDPCFSLLLKRYENVTPYGCIYAETDRIRDDVSPDWHLCTGNFQIING